MSERARWRADEPGAEPVHVRSIEIRAYEADDAFELVGRLRDDRPWADGVERAAHVHDMELRIRVDRTSLVITEAEARMDAFPHAECPTIAPSFAGLVGLSVARGYNRAVQERFGRQLGCSHLEFLARALGPAVIQAMPSAASRHVDPERIGEVVVGGAWLTNTCHLWEEGGVGMQKIAEGWRPGKQYPAPSLVEIRRRKSEEQGD